MARKLFISILGTSLYDTCRYIQGDFCSTETRFIQQATIELIGRKKEWTKEDRICILLTGKAKKCNWDKEITSQTNPHTKEEIPYEGLESVLQRMSLPTTIAPVPILDGKNEEEMWEIFQTAFDLMEDDDEVYFDLTHSFRYLPMLILVLGNYAKFLKNVHIAHISYGNYEARDKEKNEAPIVDLLPLTMLQDWTFAAADFLQNGYVDNMNNLADKSIRLLQKNEATRSQNNKALGSFVSTLKRLVDERQTCRGMDISNAHTLSTLKEQRDRIKDVVIKPLEPVIKKIMTMPTPSDSIGNCLQAARWCYDKHLYQQSATILQEGVVTFFCERHDIKIDDEKQRHLVNDAFTITFFNISEDEWNTDKEDLPKQKELLSDKLIRTPDVYNSFNNITKVRNDYNHAGFRSKHLPLQPKSMISNINKTINCFEACLTGRHEEAKTTHKLFLNLSNHPISKWDAKQLEAAKLYGEITEIPFPNLSAEVTENEIETIVSTYYEDITSQYSYAELTVHIMGEMTFSFRLVEKLKAAGIRCVASTSERVVEDLGNGKKIVQFSFVRFREY